MWGFPSLGMPFWVSSAHGNIRVVKKLLDGAYKGDYIGDYDRGY